MTVYPDDLERGYKVSHCKRCARPSVFNPCRICHFEMKQLPGATALLQHSRTGDAVSCPDRFAFFRAALSSPS